MATEKFTEVSQSRNLVTDMPSTDDLPKESAGDTVEEDYILSGAKLHVIIFGLGLAVFLMALDMSILVTAVPLITEKFHSTAEIGWYMSAYSLSMYVSTEEPKRRQSGS